MTSSIRALLLGNFFSSLAAGIVLARGLSMMKEIPGFFGDSIITFLVGGLMAFAIVIRMRARGVSTAWPLSLLALLVSFFLAWLQGMNGTSLTNHVTIFTLMSVFFAATLTTRSLRSDLAASEHSKLPLAEVAYSAGYLVGLGLTTAGAVETMAGAFIASCAALAVTVVADFYGERRLSPGEVAVAELVGVSKPRSAPLTRGDWVLAFQFGLLTVGVQIFLQRYSTWGNTSLPLAAFEVGVLCATIAAAFAHPTLLAGAQEAGLLPSRLQVAGITRTIATGPAFFATLAAPTLGTATVILGAPALVGAVVFLFASFGYEYLSLALLQHIGRNRGNVAVVFAATAVVATVAYALSMVLLKA